MNTANSDSEPLALQVQTKSAPARVLPNALVNRLPSRQDTLYVFAACVIPIFVWAFLSYLDAVPAFALRFDLWELIGSASYTLAFALFESIVILLPFVLLAAILPARFFKNHFVALGSAIILISSFWMMYANYHKLDFFDWGIEQLLPALVLYLLSLVVAIFHILRFPRVEQIIQAVIQRFSVLAYVYVALACVGVVIVIIRNL